MYEYKFEKIEMKSGFLRVNPTEDYHKIIKEYAVEDSKLIQIFAPAISGYGALSCGKIAKYYISSLNRNIFTIKSLVLFFYSTLSINYTY
ncbi:DUF4177 domain-containing protein [Clostridium ganghwense]|uniref:DUF4177 domain-containing protein n=1 Tax=Clostridium ganghwense TaxID=312089 RepID=A0ABT4CU54_9CLOT|nr:DUF4177 domain-containing protein [Clostridium ganghwense]MCY6372587.1 DUF4177 domain-containing protein [Clostridium ganghwense]